MEIGLVHKVNIDTEMQQSYLDYAMSVIVSRALPDARDGLKPVQRRILYSMYDMGLRPDTPFKKSARIVGEVLGKYHPHGDMAVYEAMARLAQDFSMRYRLVDGQGNFGSVDGDPPAAMRYTEARMTNFAIELLSQIDRNTVEFSRNFDDSLNEPTVLPAAIPNLLVNGASGIAVGMATNIPPHNLGEVIDALVYMITEWEHLDDIPVENLMRYIKGPDFPTGGIILQESGQHELLTAYATGKGRILLRGRVHAEEMGRGRSRLIINELPYMTNKATLIERIAELVRESRLDGVADLRDESDRQGMRIVLDLKQGADGDVILRDLFKHTPLESTIGINLLALVDNQPRLLTLKQALRVYIEHRIEVIRRRSEFDLAKAKARAHILEGLRIAIKNLDDIIKLIRNSPDTETAHSKLKAKYKLSDIQATAILDMPLKRLAALERKKIEDEYKELLALIKDLELLLKSPKKQRQVVEGELMAVRTLYGDKRRTQIISLKEGETTVDRLTTTDMTPAQPVWVGIAGDNIIARTESDTQPRFSSRTAPRLLIRADTHQTCYLVAQDGRTAAVAVHALPEAGKYSDGMPVHKVSPFPENMVVKSLFALPMNLAGVEKYVLTVTKQGMVKKSLVSDLPGPSGQAFTLVKTNTEDEVRYCSITSGKDELMLFTAKGMAIRFSEEEVRPMGLIATGVNGLKLSEGDEVVGAGKVHKNQDVILYASDNTSWRIPVEEFPLQGRYGQGVIACKPAGNSVLVYGRIAHKSQPVILHYQQSGAEMHKVDEVGVGKRARVGQVVEEMKVGDRMVAVTFTWDCVKEWESDSPKSVSSGDSKPRSASSSRKSVVGGKATPVHKQPKPGTQKKKKPASKTDTGKVKAKPKK
jgi:DNA gyrase subunit A